jgi:hypothetical protein
MDLVGYAVFFQQKELDLEEFDQYISDSLDNGQRRYIDYSSFSDFSNNFFIHTKGIKQLTMYRNFNNF